MTQKIAFYIAIGMMLVSPMLSYAANTDQITQLATISINPDNIFSQIKSFLIITPQKGTTSGLSINIDVNKDKVNQEAESMWNRIMNYTKAVNENIYTKTGLDILAVLTFFWDNLYALFVGTFNIIKSVLP